jgi:hypothetical protein
MSGQDLLILSTQQLIDCLPTTEGNGCGSVQNLDEITTYAKKNKILVEADYPTSGVSGASCTAEQAKGKF